MMMALGQFVFKLSTAAYQELQRTTQWRYSGSDRVGASPAYQFLGAGEETFSMSGMISPELSNPKSLDTLRELAGTGQGHAMVDGAGRVYGLYAIETVTENSSYFDQYGQPKKIEFTVALKRVGHAQSRVNEREMQ